MSKDSTSKLRLSTLSRREATKIVGGIALATAGGTISSGTTAASTSNEPQLIDVSYNPRPNTQFHHVWANEYQATDLQKAIDEVADADEIFSGLPQYTQDTTSPNNAIIEELLGLIDYKLKIVDQVEGTFDPSTELVDAYEDTLIAVVDTVSPLPVSVGPMIGSDGDFDEEGIIREVSQAIVDSTRESDSRIQTARASAGQILGYVGLAREIHNFGQAFGNMLSDSISMFVADFEHAVLESNRSPYESRHYNDEPYISNIRDLVEVERYIVLPAFEIALESEDDELLKIVGRHYDKLLDAQRSAFHDMCQGIRDALTLYTSLSFNATTQTRTQINNLYSNQPITSEEYTYDDLEIKSNNNKVAIDIDFTQKEATGMLKTSNDPRLFAGYKEDSISKKYDGEIYSDVPVDATNSDRSLADIESDGDLGPPTFALELADIGFGQYNDFDLDEPEDDVVKNIEKPPYQLHPGHDDYPDAINESHYGIDTDTLIGYLFSPVPVNRQFASIPFIGNDPPQQFNIIEQIATVLSLSDVVSTAAVTQQSIVQNQSELYTDSNGEESDESSSEEDSDDQTPPDHATVNPEIEEKLQNPENTIRSIAFSNDGEFVAIGTGDSWEQPKVHVYTTEDWSQVTELTEIRSNNVIDSISFNNDDSKIAYTGAYDDSTVYVHNTSNWELEETINGNASLYAVEYITGTNLLAYGGSNETLRIVNDNGSENTIPIDGRLRSIDSTDSGYVAVATNVGSIHIFEVSDDNLEEITTLNQGAGESRSVDFSPGGDYIAYDDEANGVVKIHNVGSDWTEEHDFSLVNGSSSDGLSIDDTAPGSVSFSPNQNLFAYPTEQNITVHDIANNWEIEPEIENGETVKSEVEFSPNGNWLVYSVNTTVYVHTVD